MTLPFLIILAIAVPTVLLILCYAFSRSIPWLGARPRVLAGLEMLIGAANVAVALADTGRDLTMSTASSLLLGAAFFAAGLHRWFRGARVEFE